MLSVRWISFYDASVGFSVATQGWIGIASSEGGARTTTQGAALPSRRLNKRRPEDRRCLMLVAFRGENGFRIGTRNFAYRDPAESTDKRRLRCEKLKHHLHAPNDFVEVVLTKLRIRFAEIGPGMDVVDHQFEVVAVDVVIQAAGDGMNTVVAHLPGV
jgi:hypothetical protein